MLEILNTLHHYSSRSSFLTFGILNDMHSCSRLIPNSFKNIIAISCSAESISMTRNNYVQIPHYRPCRCYRTFATPIKSHTNRQINLLKSSFLPELCHPYVSDVSLLIALQNCVEKDLMRRKTHIPLLVLHGDTRTTLPYMVYNTCKIVRLIIHQN